LLSASGAYFHTRGCRRRRRNTAPKKQRVFNSIIYYQKEVSMYRRLSLAVIAIVIASPAMAAATCTTAPASKFQDKAVLEKKLKGEGLTVRQIKTEKGCYEVYAVDKNGKKANAAFNAETLEQVANVEAGEN
jgi:hypothetical protein